MNAHQDSVQENMAEFYRSITNILKLQATQAFGN